MNYLTLENISKTYGEKVLFDNLSLHISQGQKVALVAKNGAGKSTLLRIVAGEEGVEGETARVMLARDVTVGYLEQDPTFFKRDTVIDAVFDSEAPQIQAIKEYEAALAHPEDGARLERAIARMEDLKAWDFEVVVKEILFKLNIQDLEQPVGTLSGGQKKRLALAKVLIEDPDFLILDEPTNHLDLEMVEWLEEYLLQPNLTLLMVTHDRYFLDRVCDTIVELDAGNLYKYSGNYTEFLEKKATREEVASRTIDRSRKLYKRELEWVQRMPKARGTKAKARVGQFESLKEELAGVKKREELQMDLKGNRLGSKILELHGVGKWYDDTVIIKDFFYKFRKNERVGVVGPNGVGKTTFLKLLTQEIRPSSGKVVVGGTVKFGYFTQSGIQLKEDKRVIEVVQDVAEYIPLEKGQKLTAAQLLERFLFSRKQQQVYVSQLSGGEKRRLHLLTVLMENPNFLILDEPTNDLDLITLNLLEEFLMEFPGCLVIVSHDRFFLDKITDHLFVFQGDGQVKDYNGKYSEYRAWKKEQEILKKREEKSTPSKTKDAPEEGPSRAEKNEFKKLERQIEALEKEKKAIYEKFTSTDLPPEEIERLSKELAILKEELEAKEERWLELADKM